MTLTEAIAEAEAALIVAESNNTLGYRPLSVMLSQEALRKILDATKHPVGLHERMASAPAGARITDGHRRYEKRMSGLWHYVESDGTLGFSGWPVEAFGTEWFRMEES